MKNQKEPKRVRTRFAPSPTGYLHIGSARTALFNYLFARHHGGTFILRIEDTDVTRSQAEFETDILEGLAWLGLTWDEGPGTEGERGEKGPYRQSARSDSYIRHFETLRTKGAIFYCTHSPEELEAEQREQTARKEAPRHVCTYRDGGAPHEVPGGVWRFKTPSEQLTFTDQIRGPITVATSLLGDFVVAKSSHTPLYNFAVVADDFEMGITHVIRGEEHISNTPRQILIVRTLFGADALPVYAHIPLILGKDKKKLSKRHGALPVRDYRRDGYLADALVNFLALLGWNPGTSRELFTRDELASAFSLDRVQKSPAVFDEIKLQWMNSQYIQRLDSGELAGLVEPYLAAMNVREPELIKKIALLEQPRMKRLRDIEELAKLFFEREEYDTEMLVWRNADAPSAFKNLEAAERILESLPQNAFVKEEIRERLMREAEREGDRGKLLWPLRVALSGRLASPDPVDIIDILGREETIFRIRAAREKLQYHSNA